jgi:hypothetical protein
MTTEAVRSDVIRTADEAVVARLLAAIGGDTPLSEAVHLLAPDVICHMDRFTARGADVWTDWVLFIRSRSVEKLNVVVDRYETGADGIITAFGGLTTGSEGTASPRPGTARYRVVDGRIVEIWTSRWNYEIIFGPRVRRPLSWLLVLVRMAMWRRLSRLHAARSHPASEEAAVDGVGDKSRHGSSADDHPQR